MKKPHPDPSRRRGRKKRIFMSKIQFAKTDSEILKCWKVMHELRPHLKNEKEFFGKTKRQQANGYQLIFIEKSGVAVCASGFRILEFLAWGKILYIDDLTTLPEHRGNGYAGKILDWLINFAKENNCDEVHLDSGHQRYDAHRLYLNKKFKIIDHHFAIKLK